MVDTPSIYKETIVDDTAVGEIMLGKLVFQPVLQNKNGRRRIHPEGDIAILLKETLGKEILGKVLISSENLEKDISGVKRDEYAKIRYGQFYDYDDKRTITYSIRVSFHITLENRGLVLSFESPANSRRSKPDEIEAREIITIRGPEGIVHRITNHQMFASLCVLLKMRDTSAIKVYEDKPATPEFSISLSRPVFQPADQAGGVYTFGKRSSEGDLSILLGRIFGKEAITKEFSWKRAFRNRGGDSGSNPLLVWASEWNTRFDVPVELGGKRFTISFEEPQMRNERLIPPEAELIARRAITVKGEEELVAQVRDHPDLAKIRSELDQRDINAIKKRFADADCAKKSPQHAHVAMKVFSKEERYSHTAGVDPDQGFMRPTSTGKPTQNVADGVKGLHMASKPQGWQ